MLLYFIYYIRKFKKSIIFLSYAGKISNNLFKTGFTADVENYLFANYTKVDKKTALETIHEIYTHYPMEEDVTYWGYPILTSTGYYISYATSALQALQLCEQCNVSLSNAKTNYLSLVSNKEDLSDIELWAKSGLASPFEESTLKEVAKIYSKR